jgi:hypothetical protein
MSPATIATSARLGPRQEVHQIVEVALLLGARRRILAGHDAHQADVVGAAAHHLQRFHQPREPIALDAHLLFDLGGGLDRALVDRRRRGLLDWRGFGGVGRFARHRCRRCRRFRRFGRFRRRRFGSRFRRGSLRGRLGRFACGRFRRCFGGGFRRGRFGARLGRLARGRFRGSFGCFGRRRFRGRLGRFTGGRFGVLARRC